MALNFQTIGPCRSAGMGVTPFDFGHVRDWRKETGQHVTHWGREALVMMSRAYTGERNRNDGESQIPPPWASEATKKNAGAALGDILRAMANERSGK